MCSGIIEGSLHNYNMQIKQLKSIINANYLSPWSDDLDLDAFLAPPPQPPLRKSQAGMTKEVQQHQVVIEEEAKKTLLNIDSDKKRTSKPQIRDYLNRKNKNQLSHMSVQEKPDFKLPPITKPYDSIDYSVHELLPASRVLEEIDLFRKYGDHRKSKMREGSKVQRSISYAPTASRDISDGRGKMETLQPVGVSAGEMIRLKLKGKKYSFQSRVQSERKLSSDQYKYIPTHPNITPHHLLFGHSKEDILKKVLQQIKIK